MLAAGGQHAAVMFELGVGEEALVGFNARPLEGKAIGVEAQIGQLADVLRVEMLVIAGVAGGFLEDALGQMFQGPEITVGIVALDLMACGGAAPEELIGERFGLIRGVGSGVWGCRCVGHACKGRVSDDPRQSGGGSALQKAASGDRFAGRFKQRQFWLIHG